MTQASEVIAKQYAAAGLNKFIWGGLGVNVRDMGAVGDGVTDDTNAFFKAISSITGEGAIIIPPGTYRIASSLTIPSNVCAHFVNGGMIAPGSGATVTINGEIIAELTQIFAGLGTVGGSFKVPTFYPQWWGAKGDGMADDTVTIQTAINAASQNGGVVFFPPGNYNCGAITLNKNNVIIRGSGSSTTIYFTSSSGTWLTVQDCGFVDIEYFNFENENNPTAGSVISIDNCAWVNIDNVKLGFYSKLYNGISITSLRGGPQAIYIKNSRIFKFKGAAISCDTSAVGSQTINDIFIDNCFIQWLATNVGDFPPSTSIGVKLTAVNAAVQAINITNCEISASYWTFYAVGSRFLHVNNTYFDGYNYFDTVNVSTFNNNWFSGSSGPNTATNAMDVRNCIGLQFVNCHIDPASVLNVSAANMIIQGACDHILVDGCMFGGAGYKGIVIGAGDNITIKGNYFGKNAAFLNTMNMVTGVEISSEFTGYANIKDNDMREMVNKIINSASTNGKIIAKGNMGYNPVGSLVAPTITASGNGYINTYPFTIRVSVAGGTGVGIYLNSTPTGLVSGSFILEPGESITLTYSSAPTSWVWQGI